MEMKPGCSRTHVKSCKMAVSEANSLGILVILTSKNQIYSKCSFVTETEFTVSMLGLPIALFVFLPNLKVSYLN